MRVLGLAPKLGMWLTLATTVALVASALLALFLAESFRVTSALPAGESPAPGLSPLPLTGHYVTKLPPDVWPPAVIRARPLQAPVQVSPSNTRVLVISSVLALALCGGTLTLARQRRRLGHGGAPNKAIGPRRAISPAPSL